jgi:hypothetical protein
VAEEKSKEGPVQQERSFEASAYIWREGIECREHRKIGVPLRLRRDAKIAP